MIAARYHATLLCKSKQLFGRKMGCGSVPASPGCYTWGDSYEHLLVMLKEAIQGWLEVASEEEEIALAAN